jgi:hypothetical protein
MKTEDFESLLRQQRQRPVPPAWRAQILARARAAAPAAPRGSLAVMLADLLWPTPKAWAGLAAAWGLILLVNFAQADGIRPTGTATSASPVYALQTQHRMMVELLDLEAPAMPATAPSKPSPRSERRPANQVG